MPTEVSVRELRNHTRDVIEAVEAGDVVYLTSRGRRIAEIRPLAPRSDAQRLVELVSRLPLVDTGAAAELSESKQASLRAQQRRLG